MPSEIGGGPNLAPRFAVRDWGLDTVSIGLWPPRDSAAGRALSSPIAGSERLSDYEGRTSVTDLHGSPVPVDGVSSKQNWHLKLGFATVLGFPDCGLLLIEGRAAAIVAGSKAERRLLRPAELSLLEGAAMRIAWGVLGRNVFCSERPIRLHRWDLTVDLANLGDANEGVRTLHALSEVRLPRWFRSTLHHAHGKSDRVNGASWPADQRRKQFRAYDKGVELSGPRHRGTTASESACEAGRWLRLERQIRPTKSSDRKTASELAASDLRSMWLGQWEPWLRAPSMTVCSPMAALARLSDLFASEGSEISTPKVSSLLGKTAAAALGLDQRIYESRQDLARRLMELGIVLAGDFPAWECVELQPTLRMAADAWSDV